MRALCTITALILIGLLSRSPSSTQVPANVRSAAAETLTDQECPLECLFLPILRFHPQEQYFPATPEWYFERVELRAEGRSTPLLGVGQVNSTEVGNRTGNTGRTTFLDIPAGRDAVRSGERNLLGAYAHVVRRDASGWPSEIQYWFFYPYSGDITPGPPNFAHEGDWEHVTVRLTPDRTAVSQIYYARHDREGEWVSAAGHVHPQTKQPIVYVARQSHASYPRAGRQARRGFLPDDETADGGLEYNFRNPQSNQNPDTWLHVDVNRPSWLRFTGRWGQPSGVGLEFTSGPRGPSLQDSWSGDMAAYPAGTIIFKDEPGCRGTERVGETSDAPRTIRLGGSSGFMNDEAKSVRLVNVRQGTEIRVYDDSNAGTHDDWAVIRVLQRVPDYCVTSFERRVDDGTVRVEVHSRDNLDGKVSHIRIN